MRIRMDYWIYGDLKSTTLQTMLCKSILGIVTPNPKFWVIIDILTNEDFLGIEQHS